MEKVKETNSDLSLETIVSSVIQLPVVQVDRNTFLTKVFEKENVNLAKILEEGPITSGISREKLSALAHKLILNRTTASSALSFLAGMPGGIAMGATLPTDILQFFACTLRLAQELAYLYDEPDFFNGGVPNSDRVKNQFIMYYGVMFGAAGAAEGVRLFTAQLAKEMLKKIPKQALTKTIWYPVLKQTCKSVGVKITKNTVAKGVSTAIPIIGGVVSGGLNFASMLPMARRLQVTLDDAHFNYTEAEMQADIETIKQLDDEQPDEAPVTDAEPPKKSGLKDKFSAGMKNVGDGVSGLFAKKAKAAPAEEAPAASASNVDDVLATIKKLAELKEIGAITQEEFDAKKIELLARL